MTEIKPVVIEKDGFENRDKSEYFFLDFNAGIKINEFSIESFSSGLKLSIDIFMEEINPAGTDKYDFQDRDKSLSTSLFGSFGL